MWIRAWRVASWKRSYRQGRQDECVSLSQLLRGFAEVHSRRPISGCTAVYWRWTGRGDDARMPTQPWRAWAWRRGVVERKKEAWALKAVMAGSGFGAWLGGLGPRTTHMQRRWVPAWTGRLLLTAASCIQLRARPDVSMQARPASTQLGTDSPTCRSRSTCRTWRPWLAVGRNSLEINSLPRKLTRTTRVEHRISTSHRMEPWRKEWILDDGGALSSTMTWP